LSTSMPLLSYSSYLNSAISAGHLRGERHANDDLCADTEPTPWA